MRRKFGCALLCLFLIGVAFAGYGESADKKYKIGLSNSYMGNDWRQIMIKTATVVAGKPPYDEKVDFSVVNCENTPEAQTATIDVMIEQGYDAILIDASSTTALTPVINRAIAAGIVCVTFDSVADHPDVYIAQTNLADLSKAWANFLVAQLKPGAKIAVDTGLPGMTNGNIVYETAMKIFKDAGINVVAEFAGEWADGVGQQKISSVLAANPDLDGLFSQVYGETILAAFTQAGRDLIPCTAYDTNAGMLAALDNNMNIIIGNNAPGLSAIALSVAVRVLDGEKVDKLTEITPGLFSNVAIDVGFPVTKIVEGVNAFRDLPGALDWPVLPADFEPSVTIEEIANYQN
ncbi:MAG: substrate-binding domain-containing protein [Synergistaceae bacterium]|jgi:ribose transport system substrate-binding protein|nr:substrate-binding domain-containing protein [Synergistaceae bacterium]